MSGERYLLDTNAIVQLLAGNSEVADIVRKAFEVSTSIVCELEFLSFPRLSAHDAELFRAFSSRVPTYQVPANDSEFTDAVVRLRRTRTLKMPDAIIAATAMVHNSVLVSADAHFSAIEGLFVQSFTPIVS